MVGTETKAMKYTAADKLRYIDAVLFYIEKHLPEEINPENIAERHYISLSQLYRDFYACTGHSIKDMYANAVFPTLAKKSSVPICPSPS